jgi:hypothetical protein
VSIEPFSGLNAVIGASCRERKPASDDLIVVGAKLSLSVINFVVKDTTDDLMDQPFFRFV